MSKDASHISLHQVSEFIRKFTDAEGSATDLQKVIESPGNQIAPVLVRVIREFYESVDPAKAIDLIDFVNNKVLYEHFGYRGSSEGLMTMGRVPFPIATLRERQRSGYFLVPVGPFTLREICATFEQYVEISNSLTEDTVDWDQVVSKTWRWSLFGKEVLSRSVSYSNGYHWDFARQEGVEIATMAEALYCTLLWYVAKEERLFPDVLVTDGRHLKVQPSGGKIRCLCVGEFKRDRVRLVDAEVPGAGIGAACIIRSKE